MTHILDKLYKCAHSEWVFSYLYNKYSVKNVRSSLCFRCGKCIARFSHFLLWRWEQVNPRLRTRTKKVQVEWMAEVDKTKERQRAMRCTGTVCYCEHKMHLPVRHSCILEPLLYLFDPLALLAHCGMARISAPSC